MTEYNNPEIAVTAVPMSITGNRPARSAMRPLKNRETKAPTVKSPTIQPTQSGFPNSAKNPGNSGNNIPKLAMKNTVLQHKRQKAGVKSVPAAAVAGESEECIMAARRYPRPSPP